jgi:LPXTG-motif cell wall-anchored protein
MVLQITDNIKASRPTLANTGQSLKAITIVATMALGLAGYVKVKNKSSREPEL